MTDTINNEDILSKTIKAGYVAMIGRPNVGKSTLLNRLVGQKISITARKPQTTRHRILGIKSTPTAQIIYIDTPGMHLGGKRAINRYLNKTASRSVQDGDIILFLVSALTWSEEDEFVLQQLKNSDIPIILVINKIDLVKDKTELLPFIESVSKKLPFIEIVPISARHGKNVNDLEATLEKLLPVSTMFYPEGQVTDKDEKFLAAEFIREKLIMNFGHELPYATAVEIEEFSKTKKIINISAVIWVERRGQKKIIIGKSGQSLKTVGTEARKDMERSFGTQVYLQLWVKVKEGWSNDGRLLSNLGYRNDF